MVKKELVKKLIKINSKRAFRLMDAIKINPTFINKKKYQKSEYTEFIDLLNEKNIPSCPDYKKEDILI